MAESADFERLRQKRLRYVDAAQENDFEEGLKNLLSELYPDNAHFIYELLQNAEDALATRVQFWLGQDRLTVTHDGKRPFSIADIESITGIGNSTKTDDLTQIGKFGVGFKAVFAYTTRPEVRSGEYSFAIEDLFVPVAVDGTCNQGLTTFTFPFDRAEKPTETARLEVERGLSDLDEQTLLFLNHITTIAYELPDGAAGIIERIPIDDRIITIRRSERDDFVESHWLRLVGGASIDGVGSSPLTVAAAFKVEITDRQPSKKGRQGESLGSTARRSVVPLDEGDVSIYFPAAKESSGLRFHIHAPFASTVARDSVRDIPGNVRLVGDIARLISDALPGMCADGLIDDSFLEALPNADDQIWHPYDLIRDGITEAFNNLEITPVRGAGAGFAAAKTLVSSPSEFRNWLESADLPKLCGFAGIETEVPPRWIRDRDGRSGKFLAGLDSIKFGWQELSTAIVERGEVDTHFADDSDKRETPIGEWMAWISAKSDESLLGLYQLIGHGIQNKRLQASLDHVPIVRLRTRGQLEHVRGHETFLPETPSDKVQSRIPANLAYFDDDDDDDVTYTANLKAFYRAVGAKRWDESARLERRLASYRNRERPIPEGDELTQHLEDVRAFVRYADKQHNAGSALSTVPFLLAELRQGHQKWVTPTQIFVDIPFCHTGLSALYPESPPYLLAGLYLEVEGIVECLAALGAQTGIEIVNTSVTENQDFDWSWTLRNRETAYVTRIDWCIEGLGDIIEAGDPDLLRALWSTVVAASESKALAIYQANSSAQRHQMVSQLARSLTSTPWVLDREGDLKLPREVSVDDLPDDWQVPDQTSLVYRLDFGADAARRRREREGVTDFLRGQGLDEDALDLVREATELGLDLRTIIREYAAKAQFPAAPSEDPDRRVGVATMDAITAPEHTTSTHPRSVVDGQVRASAESKAYLRSQYTTPTGEMHCQACRKQLPFKTKDGLWYFEAVRFVNARKQVHTSNAIALCPLCAALHKYARGTKNDTILEHLRCTIIEPGQGTVEVPVVLNGKRVLIAFTGKHAIDIKTALGVAGDERSDNS